MKNSMPPTQQVEDFCRRTLASLPDSLEKRIADLEVLVCILPSANFGRQAAEKMLIGLRQSEQAQREFCFNFNQPEAA